VTPGEQQAYAAGKENGRSDGRLDVLADLARYAGAMMARAEALPSHSPEQAKMLAGTEAISAFSQDYINRMRAGQL
jgi:hypothetical protein